MTPEQAHAEAIRRINRCAESGEEIVDLGDLPMVVLPEEMGRLTHLKVLALGMMKPTKTETGVLWEWDQDRPFQQFRDLDVLSELTNLTSLNLSRCSLLQNVDVLSELTNLTSLDLSWCAQLQNVDGLSELTNLTSLDLNWCAQLQNVDVLSELTNLTKLNLRRCSRLQNVDVLSGLIKLTQLDLSGCDQLQNVDVLSGLTNLTKLNLSYCRQLQNVDGLSGLINLTQLNLSGCYLLQNVDVLSGLTNLTRLYLSYCRQLQNVDGLSGLINLTQLNLSGCEQLQNVDVLSALINLTQLRLSSCGRLAFGPLRRLLQGKLTYLYLYGTTWTDLNPADCGDSEYDNCLEAVRAHYEDLDADPIEDTQLKMFVLGNGRVGKSQLCRRLCDLRYDDKVPTTHGVQLGDFTLTVGNRRLEVRYWDFGGQDVYHGTHALFLDGHAIYVVLWHPDFEQGEENDELSGLTMRRNPLGYWLDYIRATAGTQAPVLVIQARCDSSRDRVAPPSVDVGDFRYVKFLEFSALTDLGLSAVKGHLEEAVRNLVESRPLFQIGRGRVMVREALQTMLKEDKDLPDEQKRHRTISREAFHRECDRTQGRVHNADALLNFLHNTGVVFYRPGLFEDRIILDQPWALDAIYAVFHRRQCLPYLFRDGRFTRELLGELVWKDKSVREQQTLLAMMVSCGICFKARNLAKKGEKEQWEYIAPDLLPEENEVKTQLDWLIPREEPDAKMSLTFALLHQGILRTFLSKIGDKAGDVPLYWRYGCIFQDEKTRSRVLIRSVGRRLQLSAWQGEAAVLLDNLLEILKRIPMGRQPELERGMKPGVEVRQRETAEEAAIRAVPAPHIGTKTQVFVSYAWGDDTAEGKKRAQVVERLCERLREWKYEVIRDKEVMRTGDSIRAFMTRLSRADRVVVILSEKYLRSPYCMTELHEIYLSSRSDAAEFRKRIIPLTLEDAKISSIKERGLHAKRWREDMEGLKDLLKDLGDADLKAWKAMKRWATDVGDILFLIADTLQATGFEAIMKDDFEGVKERL